MNAVAKPKRDSLPINHVIPARSPKLAAAMECFGNIEGDVRQVPPWVDELWFAAKMPDSAVIAEAQQLATAYERALAPAGAGAVQAWLLPIAAGVSNPPTAGDFAARAAAIAMICSSMASCCFTESSQRDALCRFRFWPAAAEVHALLVEYSDPVRRRYRDILKIARVRPMAEYAAVRRAYREAADTDCYPCERSATPMSGSL